MVDSAKSNHKNRVDRYNERNQEKGIIKVQVRIPSSKRDALIALAAEWRDEPTEVKRTN
jgi:hypothetical protein